MAINNNTPGASFVLSLFLSLITFSLLQLYRDKLCSTPQFTILAGILCSVLFLFVIIAVSNISSCIFQDRHSSEIHTVGYIETFIALFITAITAGTISNVSITVSILSSIGVLVWLSNFPHSK